MRPSLVFLTGVAVFIAALVAPLAAPVRPAVALTNCEAGDFSNDSEELEFLRIINDYRVRNGRNALTISQNLNRAAHWMATDMATRGYFGHVDSLGRDPWVRIVDCGYPIAGGENLAAGTYRSTAAGAFELFQKSPSHNENMLLDRYVQIGIARVHAPGSEYGWYWATTFGTTDDGTSVAAPEPTAEPPVMARAPGGTFRLHTGANFVAWTGDETTPHQLFAQAGTNIRMVYLWDAPRQAWKRYGPGLPAFVQSLDRVRPGDGLWVVASTPGELRLSR